MDARTNEEEEEEVDTTEIAVMTCVQGEIVIVRIAPVDAMMTAARMVARDIVVLTALRRLM
jgi:hypothetical protein